ncbi:hypothetical protein Neosp_007192 [[Neocosmospora] mangrovei]
MALFTVDYDTYKGKSIPEMIDILSRSFGILQRNFPPYEAHSQVLRSDVDRQCQLFREWAEDPELPVKANVSKPRMNQMRKLLYEIGSLLDADIYLNEVDAHLRDLHGKSKDAEKELEKKKEEKEKEEKDKKDKK